MASSQGATLDSVIINIESDASNASDGISSLITQLTSLKSAISGGFNNISKLAKSLTELKPATKGLSNVATNLENLDTISDNLQKLSEVETPSGLTYTITRLKELGEVSKDIGKTSKEVAKVTTMTKPLMSLSSIGKPLGLNALVKDLAGLKSLGGLDNTIEEVGKLPQMVEPLEKIGNIQVSRGLGSLVKNLDKIPDIMSKLGNTQTLENIGRVSQELVTHMQPLADMMSSISNGYSALSKMADTYGVSAKTITRYTKQQTSIFKVLGDSLKTVARLFKDLRGGISNFGNAGIKGMEKLNSKLKQIMLSLIGTRTLFTMLRKAVSEYMQMDVELQKYTQNVWRAFGAQLAPAIEYAMYLFKQFVRVIYSVVLALTGIDLIARANAKAMDAWGKSAKDTLGNLQKFDDLNVVEFPKDKSGGLEDSLIDLDAIDLTPFQKIIDWVKELRDKIKEALDTGEWYNVGKVFADGINGAINFLLDKLPLVREVLFDIARNFGEFLNGAIENVKWDNVAKFISESLITVFDTFNELLKTINWASVGDAINDFFEGFNLVGFVHSLINAFGTAILGFTTMLINIDWGMVARKIGDAIVTFFSDLTSILDKIPWEQLGIKLREAIENVPWGEIWDKIVGLAIESFGDFGKFIGGLFDLDSTQLEKIKKALVGIGVAFVTYKLVDNITKFAKGIASFGGGFAQKISDVATGFSNVKTNIENMGKAWELVSQNTLTTDSIAGITGVSDTLVGAMPALQGFISMLGGITPFVGILAGLVAVVVAVGVAFKQLYEENEGFRKLVDDLGKMIKNTFSKVLESLKEIVDTLWTALKDFYEGTLKPLFQFLVDLLKPYVEAFIKILSVLWKNVLDPLVDFIMTGLKVAFDVFATALTVIAKVTKPVIDILSWLWKNILEPLVKFMLNNVINAIVKVTDKIREKIDFVTDKFEKMHKFLKDMISGIKGGFTGFANFIIDKLEWLINKIIGGINGLIKKLNKIKIDVPEGVPGIGGTTFGFNINTLEEVKLPRLAKGTNEIEAEGIYHLHPGEAVVPKQYNPALGGGTNRETNERLDTLIGILNNMNFTNVVNIGNEKIYEQQQNFNKFQQNKYGTIDLY